MFRSVFTFIFVLNLLSFRCFVYCLFVCLFVSFFHSLCFSFCFMHTKMFLNKLRPSFYHNSSLSQFLRCLVQAKSFPYSSLLPVQSPRLSFSSLFISLLLLRYMSVCSGGGVGNVNILSGFVFKNFIFSHLFAISVRMNDAQRPLQGFSLFLVCPFCIVSFVQLLIFFFFCLFSFFLTVSRLVGAFVIPAIVRLDYSF